MHRPHLIFLCETKLRSKQIMEKGKNLNFNNYFTVERNGLGGGLALLWNDEIVVDIKSYSMHHIDVVVHMNNGCY